VSADRWVPTQGYMLARVDGKVLVLRHGRKHVKAEVPDDEVMQGVAILRALRAAMPPPDEVPRP
jgi:hypothetical protein